MSKNNEQLNRLLLQLMDGPQACEFQEDLASADDLYAKHPAGHVRPQVLSEISKKVRRKLKVRHFRMMTEWISVAAAVVIGTVLAGLFLLQSSKPVGNQPGGGQSVIIANASMSHIWSDAYILNAIETDPIEKELDELSESFRSVDFETYESPDILTIDLMEIEQMERIAENTSFWKG